MVPLAGITRELYRMSKKIHQLIIIIVYLPEQSPDYPYFTEYLPRSTFSLDRLHNFAWGFVATPCYYIVLRKQSEARRGLRSSFLGGGGGQVLPESGAHYPDYLNAVYFRQGLTCTYSRFNNQRLNRR